MGEAVPTDTALSELRKVTKHPVQPAMGLHEVHVVWAMAAQVTGNNLHGVPSPMIH